MKKSVFAAGLLVAGLSATTVFASTIVKVKVFDKSFFVGSGLESALDNWCPASKFFWNLQDNTQCNLARANQPTRDLLFYQSDDGVISLGGPVTWEHGMKVRLEINSSTFYCKHGRSAIYDENGVVLSADNEFVILTTENTDTMADMDSSKILALGVVSGGNSPSGCHNIFGH